MASAVQSLRLSGKNLRCTKLSVRRITPSIYEARTFSTTFPRHVPRQEEEELAGIIDDDEDGDDDESTDEFIRSTSPFLFKPDKRKFKEGFHNLGEEGSGMVLPDEDFGEDDITGVAHGQLDEHREYRHYLRIAAWEMPLLSNMCKPFLPPAADQPLRFRYTSYLGEKHPAAKKVVVEFCPGDMPLTAQQVEKLKKLLGPRYNPETEIAKMSSDIYENQAQNKRYLGDLVNTLLDEARDTTDTLEDLPVDTRHHVFRKKPRFPVEWRMTEERQSALKGARANVRLIERERAARGEVVDGRDAIMRNLKKIKGPESAFATIRQRR